MCQSGVTCVPVNCCISELALWWQSVTVYWRIVFYEVTFHKIKVSCAMQENILVFKKVMYLIEINQIVFYTGEIIRICLCRGL
jgi:hypothetical protein